MSTPDPGCATCGGVWRNRFSNSIVEATACYQPHTDTWVIFKREIYGTVKFCTFSAVRPCFYWLLEKQQQKASGMSVAQLTQAADAQGMINNPKPSTINKGQVSTTLIGTGAGITGAGAALSAGLSGRHIDAGCSSTYCGRYCGWRGSHWYYPL